jgi:hypothetical protein
MAVKAPVLSADAQEFVPDFLTADTATPAAGAATATATYSYEQMVAIRNEVLSASIHSAVVQSLKDSHGGSAAFVLVSPIDASCAQAAAATSQSLKTSPFNLFPVAPEHPPLEEPAHARGSAHLLVAGQAACLGPGCSKLSAGRRKNETQSRQQFLGTTLQALVLDMAEAGFAGCY